MFLSEAKVFFWFHSEGGGIGDDELAQGRGVFVGFQTQGKTSRNKGRERGGERLGFVRRSFLSMLSEDGGPWIKNTEGDMEKREKGMVGGLKRRKGKSFKDEGRTSIRRDQ